ncbi:biotin/lipoyl-containing protein [Palleronia caenipelagi]|uniref:Pyruvate dehydrogenase n=1 Tax=Palleronia caenipelagi TaxID=2489174 RepID=A0A547QA22_9RHOB|nr:biotin/lipoyl-containing protein [Palleronia caenipelagi]TRD23210.1 pyruvate dehydrogenase [Palleronia caenipelagi]
MPHEVTMPQLGMAQDTGRIVSWLKSPGDAVAKGDALFEVETDKATMEVEAQAAGFLTGVTAAAGDDVPVGQAIAQISETAEEPAAAPATTAAPEAGNDLPEGTPVTMPQLGMAQDAGRIVGWLVEPGAEVGAEDPLFEVETDKATMEVPAGRAGYLAATLAQAGEDVPVGDPVAILSDSAPANPVSLSVKDAAPASAPAPAAVPDAPAKEAVAPRQATAAPIAPGGRILASPKARRLAMEQGLDLNRLVEGGHPQPYHVADLDVLRSLPAATPAAAAGAGPATRRLTAHCATDGFAGFADWAAGTHGLTDADALLAGLAGVSLGRDGSAVAVERFGTARSYAVTGPALSQVAETEDAPALILRDLRGTGITGIEMGAEDAPVLTLTAEGAGIGLTLECGAGQLSAAEAIALLSNFAGRMEQPLRHLL